MSEIKQEIESVIAKLKAAAENRAPRDDLSPEQVAAAARELRTRYGVAEPSLEERMKQRGIPQRIADMILAAKVQTTDATRLAWQLTDGPGFLLVLAGNTGRGKSVAAAWALSQRPGLWLESWQLARVDETGTLDARARTCGMLVVDDLGVEHSPSGYAASRLDGLVSHRESHRRPTLLTTNLTVEAFRDRYGARLASRVNGDPLGWHDLAGHDMRSGA